MLRNSICFLGLLEEYLLPYQTYFLKKIFKSLHLYLIDGNKMRFVYSWFSSVWKRKVLQRMLSVSHLYPLDHESCQLPIARAYICA